MPIREIAIVHLSHTDFGFTDHPAVFADLQRRYLDIALDAALRDAHRAAGRALRLDRREHGGI